MSKNAKRFQQKSAYPHKGNQNSYNDQHENNVVQVEFCRPASKPLEALTHTQATQISSMLHDNFAIAIGPAGTGKTYVAAAVASELLLNKHVKQIILTRPNVEVGKSLGYLPGELEDKYAPYLEPFKKGLVDRLGSNKFKADYNRRIVPKPLGFMRGDTFDDAILMLDEAQNTTIEEMKMFITRAGTNCRVFITGDISQTDIKVEESGLAWLVRQIRMQQKCYDIIEYRSNECVRSDLCKDMLSMIENAR